MILEFVDFIRVFDLDFLLQAFSKSRLIQKKACVFSGVGTDSREPLDHKVFFALKGPRFDAHDFLNQAREKGAKAFVVSGSLKSQAFLRQADLKSVSVILVPDTLKALTELAKAWRQKQKIKTIGITGSNGKTSVRCFTETLLSGLSPFASPKSYNNAIGVSLSLLAVKKKSSLLIQEIGASRPGEIDFLTKLAEPFVSAVTMVGPSHLLEMKSLSAVAEEKQNIYLTEGIGVFNKDNFWTLKMWERLSKKCKKSFSFSSKKDSVDVWMEWIPNSQVKSVKDEKICFYRSLRGRIGGLESESKVGFSENLENLMCSSAIALAVGLDPSKIWDKLSECRLPRGRREWFYLKDHNLSLCFDAYNANPSSMSLFFDSMAQAVDLERRVFVLGDMKELGDQAEFYHKQLAQDKNLLNSKAIFFIGEYGGLLERELKKNQFKGFFKKFKSYQDCLPVLKQNLKSGDFIGFKASRSLFLERIFYDLSGFKIFESKGSHKT